MKAPIELISKVSEFNELSEELKDEDLDQALAWIIQLIAKPDSHPQKVSELLVQLQAIAAKFGVLSTYYKSFDKGNVNSPQGKRKAMYYTMNKEITELVQALKYLRKENNGTY